MRSWQPTPPQSCMKISDTLRGVGTTGIKYYTCRASASGRCETRRGGQGTSVWTKHERSAVDHKARTVIKMSSRRREDEPITQSYSLNRPNEFTKLDLKPRRYHFYNVLLFIFGTVLPPLGISHPLITPNRFLLSSSRLGPLWCRPRLLAQHPFDSLRLHSRRVPTQSSSALPYRPPFSR
jgi:hypothetical protein